MFETSDIFKRSFFIPYTHQRTEDICTTKYDYIYENDRTIPEHHLYQTG